MNLSQEQLSELAFQKLVHITKTEPHFKKVLLTLLAHCMLEWAEKHSLVFVDSEIEKFVQDYWRHMSGAPVEDENPMARFVIVKG